MSDGFPLGERVEPVGDPGIIGIVGPIDAPQPAVDAVPVHWPDGDWWERPEDLRRVSVESERLP